MTSCSRPRASAKLARRRPRGRVEAPSGPGSQNETGMRNTAGITAEFSALASPTPVDHKATYAPRSPYVPKGGGGETRQPSPVRNWQFASRSRRAPGGYGGKKSAVETADQPDVGVREVLEEVQAACRELARLKEVDELADLSLRHALALTKSSVAFLGLTDEAGAYDQVFSRSADTSRTAPPGEAERLVRGEISSSNPAVCAQPLESGGETIGMIGVARELKY